MNELPTYKQTTIQSGICSNEKELFGIAINPKHIIYNIKCIYSLQIDSYPFGKQADNIINILERMSWI